MPERTPTLLLQRRLPISRRGAFTSIELLVVIAIIAVLIALLLPAVQKVREESNTIKAAEGASKIGFRIHTYFDSHNKMPSKVGDLGGLLDDDPLLLSGRKSGYVFDLEPVAERKLNIHARPAAPGVTGSEDILVLVTALPNEVGQPTFMPAPGADAAREAMFAEVYRVGLEAVGAVLSLDEDGQARAGLEGYICDAMNIGKAFSDLDANHDGKVAIYEVQNPEVSQFGELARFVEAASSAMQLGLANEDVAGIPGVTLPLTVEPVCSLNLLPGGFHRGDSNTDGTVDISDGAAVFGYLFLGGAAPGCLEAANANDDARIDISDGVYILNFLFIGGPEPPSPGPPPNPCGEDPAGAHATLGCQAYDQC